MISYHSPTTCHRSSCACCRKLSLFSMVPPGEYGIILFKDHEIYFLITLSGGLCIWKDEAISRSQEVANIEQCKERHKEKSR